MPTAECRGRATEASCAEGRGVITELTRSAHGMRPAVDYITTVDQAYHLSRLERVYF